MYGHVFCFRSVGNAGWCSGCCCSWAHASTLLPSSSLPPSPNQIPLSDPTFTEPKLSDENLEEQEENLHSKETFYNQNIPYPVINDKRDLEVINRQLKNQLRSIKK